MEIVSLFLSLISIGIATITFFYSKKKIESLRYELSRQKALFNKFIVENLMFAEDTHSRNLFRENVTNLARKIFLFLKKRYGLSSTNYAELVEELKTLNIKSPLKEELIEFFSSIILLEYSKESLTKAQKRNLKKRAMEIIKKMGQIPAMQE